MLTVKYSDDEKQLKGLFERLCLHDEPTSGIIALLLDEEVAVGFCKMMLTEEGCEIVNFVIDEDEADFPTVDFFFRTVLFKLSRSEVKVLVKGYDERLIKFGFVKSGDYMAVRAPDIQFPSSCGGNGVKI